MGWFDLDVNVDVGADRAANHDCPIGDRADSRHPLESDPTLERCALHHGSHCSDGSSHVVSTQKIT
jgi:hypothetical protein